MDSLVGDIHFSIVVLGYGAGTSLVPFVEKLHKILGQFDFNWEIILVGNYLPGEKDDTPQIVKHLAETLTRVRFIAEPKEGMAGWDLRRGMDLAQGKYIGFIDGDGQMPLESIVACLQKIETEQLDLVKTYRVARDDGFYRRFISFIYNKLFRILFRVQFRDINSNPKIFLRSKYALLNLQSEDWFIDAEMMIQAKEHGFSIGEMPIHFGELVGRASFVKVGAIFEFLRNMFRYRFCRSRIHPMGAAQTMRKL